MICRIINWTRRLAVSVLAWTVDKAARWRADVPDPCLFGEKQFRIVRVGGERSSRIKNMNREQTQRTDPQGDTASDIWANFVLNIQYQPGQQYRLFDGRTGMKFLPCSCSLNLFPAYTLLTPYLYISNNEHNDLAASYFSSSYSRLVCLFIVVVLIIIILLHLFTITFTTA